MKKLKKNLPRLLVISKDNELRNDFVTLLSGYGYFVDYVKNRAEGIRKFRQHKQAVVIIDVASLPTSPSVLFRLFKFYTQYPIIAIAVRPEEEKDMQPYLDYPDLYDVLPLPINMENLDHTLRRLVKHHNLRNKFEFYQVLSLALFGILPIFTIFIIMLFFKVCQYGG